MDAPKKLCFGGKPHEVRPMVWPDRRSLRGAKSLEACPQGAARELMLEPLCRCAEEAFVLTV